MRFTPGYRSSNVVDRRGSGGMGGAASLIGILPLLFRSKLGWVGILIAIVVGVLWMRMQGSSDQQQGAVGREDSELVSFSSFVLDDAQRTWQDKIKGYRDAKLVLFTDSTSSRCGYGDAATGPFYCPADEHVYLDLSFFRALDDKLGAPGDFAQAYVIAHEIGHHVQTVLGTQGASVPIELQADCYAGVWAHSTKERDLLEKGDIEEAMNAAAAIGDDTLQSRSGRVRPETFTHGTSEQRAYWFRRGLDSGDPKACDTFSEATSS